MTIHQAMRPSGRVSIARPMTMPANARMPTRENHPNRDRHGGSAWAGAVSSMAARKLTMERIKNDSSANISTATRTVSTTEIQMITTATNGNR